MNPEFLLFVAGFLSSSGIWLIILRNTKQEKNRLKQSYTSITHLREENRNLLNENSNLNVENSEILSKFQSLENELVITKMEHDGDIQGLSNIVIQEVTKNLAKGTKAYFAEKALIKLGFQRIFHDEEFHYVEWESEEEVDFYDWESRGSGADPQLIDGTYTQTISHCKKIIDKPAYVEIVNAK